MAKRGAYDNPFSATWKGISDLFRTQERVGRLSDSDRLDGKTALITGSSSGLGLATAVELARRGARVLMAVRSGIPEKGEYVKSRSGSDEVEMLPVDLADLDRIEDLIQELKGRNETLDLVLCNAAVVPRQSRKTPQGLEEMFMVNYLSKFILLNRLLEEDLIRPAKAGELPRIVITSSESHRNPKAFEWEAFGQYKSYGIQESIALYGYYKLMLTTFARELSRRLNGNGQQKASVFAFCPGPVNSNIAREAPTAFQPLLRLVFSLFFRSPEAACESVVYLAASPDLSGKPFDYLFLMARKPIDPKAEDETTARQLWKRSEEVWESVKSQRVN